MAKKGEKMSLDVRRKIAKALVGNKNSLGHRHTKEARHQMSLSQKGHPHYPNSGFQKGHKIGWGKKNAMWKGDKASYGALHKWVVVRLGKPNKCEMCLLENKKKYEWASKTHKYFRELSDWIRLCTSCHRKYDIANNNYRIAYLDK